MATAGADDLEEVQLAVQAFVFFQADNDRNVLEEPRCLADLVPKRGLKVVVVEIVQFQCGHGDTGTFQLENLFNAGVSGIGHEGVSSMVLGDGRGRSGLSSKRMPDQPVLMNWRILPWLLPAGSSRTWR